jgi:hypothetical protein
MIKMAKIDDEQFVYANLSQELKLSDTESDNNQRSEKDLRIQAGSESENQVSKEFRFNQVSQQNGTVSQQRRFGFRRLSALSEY